MPEVSAPAAPASTFTDSFAVVDAEDLATLVLVGGFSRVEELLDAHQESAASGANY
jgi:hypothetical protein